MPARVPAIDMVGEFSGSPASSLPSIGLRQAEVEDFDVAVRADFDVGWLQVAVDQAALVRRFERVGDLERDPQRLGQRHSAAGNPRRQILSLDQLHDQRRDLAPFVAWQFCDFVDLGDVGVTQGGERLGFAFEARQPLRVCGEEFGEDLDGDVAIEPRVARAIDLAHTTGAKGRDNGVRTKAGPGR